jgi:hypothetical protein
MPAPSNHMRLGAALAAVMLVAGVAVDAQGSRRLPLLTRAAAKHELARHNARDNWAYALESVHRGGCRRVARNRFLCTGYVITRERGHDWGSVDDAGGAIERYRTGRPVVKLWNGYTSLHYGPDPNTACLDGRRPFTRSEAVAAIRRLNRAELRYRHPAVPRCARG